MANTNVKRVKTSDLELKDRLVAIQRVTKVTKGGRHFSFAAIVVVGDENGVVGYGLGKANEVQLLFQRVSRMQRRISLRFLSSTLQFLTSRRLSSVVQEYS